MSRRAAKLRRGVFETSPGSNKFGIRIIDANGNRPERVIGTLADAIKAAKVARKDRRRSKVLAPEKPRLTFREIANFGIAYAKQHHSDPNSTERMLNFVCVDFGDLLADTISKTDIENWLNNKAAKRDWSDGKWTTETKRHYRSSISISYNEAMRFGLFEVNPTADIVYRRASQKEIRTLTSEELERIRTSIAIPGNHRRPPKFCRQCLAQFEVALQTGMRMSEQFSATWEKIDWKRRVLFIPKSKNREPKDVYLNSYALAILRALQVDQTRDGILPTGKIFRIINPKGWYKKTLKHAGIQGVNWHTLRHQFATSLVEAKVPIRHIQDLMGHLDWESTARYIHPADKDVMAGIASITDDSIPEYLMNRSFIQSLLNNDADAETPVAAPPMQKDEIEQASPVEEAVGETELPPKMLTRIPREEFYNLVWAEPMIHVARRFGRSDVALAKACRKLNVPLPGRGYWQKVATGKPVSPRPPLTPYSA